LSGIKSVDGQTSHYHYASILGTLCEEHIPVTSTEKTDMAYVTISYSVSFSNKIIDNMIHVSKLPCAEVLYG
jgi:hypothetical protein